MIDIIHKPEFLNNQLIHGDLSIDNLRGIEKNNSLTVIDFEFVCLGDSLWDYVIFNESIFAKFFSKSYQDIEQARFTFFITFFKNVYIQFHLSNHRKDLKK